MFPNNESKFRIPGSNYWRFSDSRLNCSLLLNAYTNILEILVGKGAHQYKVFFQILFSLFCLFLFLFSFLITHCFSVGASFLLHAKMPSSTFTAYSRKGKLKKITIKFKGDVWCKVQVYQCPLIPQPDTGFKAWSKEDWCL